MVPSPSYFGFVFAAEIFQTTIYILAIALGQSIESSWSQTAYIFPFSRKCVQVYNVFIFRSKMLKWGWGLAVPSLLEASTHWPTKAPKFPRARWFCRLCEYQPGQVQRTLPGYQALQAEHDQGGGDHPVPPGLPEVPAGHCWEGVGAVHLNIRQAVSLPAASVHPGLYDSSLSGFANFNLEMQITSHIWHF